MRSDDDRPLIIRHTAPDGTELEAAEGPRVSGQEGESDREPYWSGSLDGDEEDAVEPDEERGPSGRGVLIALAIVAAVVLIGLAGYFLMQLRSSDQIEVDTNGIEVELVITGPGEGENKTFSGPGGVAFGPDGKIYVADSENDRIVVMTSRGRFFQEYGGQGIAKPSAGAAATWEPGLLNYPIDVVVDSNGDVYVAELYNDSISVFDSGGRFLRRFPDPDKPVGKGSSGYGGTGIAVTAIALSDEEVYATDSYQVCVFSKDGEFKRQFGRPGADDEGLEHPNGIAVDASGRVYVSDSNNNRVKAYGPDGTLLWTVGARQAELQEESDEPVLLPRGLVVQRDGAVLVADAVGQSLVRIDQNGRSKGIWGMQGSAKGQLNFPNDVAVRGELVLVADKANDRVQLVRLSSR